MDKLARFEGGEARVAAEILRDEYGAEEEFVRWCEENEGEPVELVGVVNVWDKEEVEEAELLLESDTSVPLFSVELHHGGAWDLQIDVRREVLVDAGLSAQEAYAQALRERGWSRSRIAEELEISRDQVNPVLYRVDRKVERARRLVEELDG